MTIYLKQSTASQEILLGPFLSSTDGTTAKTGLTIANTDIKIWKTGGTTVGDKASGGATEISAGYYYAVLDATDTDTLGSLIITVNVATALMIRLECAVLSASVYDSWFSTGVLPVDVTTIHGSALTETAGQLAAGFTKFFDVAAPASTMELITAVTTCTTNTDMRGTDGAGLATELAKVPKSDSTVTWNATALASIQTEANDALIANNLDHLLLTPVAEDMTAQCADGTIFGRLLGGPDTSAFIGTDCITDIHAAIVALAADVGDAGLDSLVSKVDGITTEMAKVPKSDSNVTWNVTALGSINAEVDAALNTAIPSSNTADSVNDILLDQLKAKFPTNYIMGSSVQTDKDDDIDAILADTGELQTDWVDGGRLDLLLDGASSAGDPWSTALPGEYGAGTAGLLIGTTLPAAIADLPTNTEFEARTLAAADYVVTTDTIAGVTTVTTATNLTNLPAISSEWLTAAGIKDDAVTKIQTGLATPTNITAGTITTVTNLTNAPTTGDLTTTMKASVTAAVPTAANVSDAVWDEVSTGHVDAGKAGAQVWTDIDAVLEDTGTTLPATLTTINTRTYQNYKITDPAFSATGKMTSCTVTRYPTKADADAGTNGVAYAVTATYDVDDNLATYNEVAAS